MNTETIALILTTVTAIAAAVKAMAEAKKASLEKVRADKAERSTEAVVKGVEKFKSTMLEKNISKFLTDEIQSHAKADGIEEDLNKVMEKVKKTKVYSSEELRKRLDTGV